jgi:hypothetical protein
MKRLIKKEIISKKVVQVDWDEIFYPCYTPKEMLKMGIFEGKYLNDEQDKFPKSWFKEAKISGVDGESNETLNKYKVKSRSSLQEWKIKGWIKKWDKKGWFQWYCNYFLGRRTADDERQINRWRSFVARHMGQIGANCDLNDHECRPRQRQGLLQWAWNSEYVFDDNNKKSRNISKMKRESLRDRKEVDLFKDSDKEFKKEKKEDE